jgi:hypothetical protein
LSLAVLGVTFRGPLVRSLARSTLATAPAPVAASLHTPVVSAAAPVPASAVTPDLVAPPPSAAPVVASATPEAPPATTVPSAKSKAKRPVHVVPKKPAVVRNSSDYGI